MPTAFYTRAVVQDGGKIEITDSNLLDGESVDIFVVRSEWETRERPSALDILALAPGQRLFQTATEVDKFVHEERETWES